VGLILRFLTVEGSDGRRTSWVELSLGKHVPDPPNLPSFHMYGHPHYLPFDGLRWTIARRIHLCPDPRNQENYTIFNLRATRLILDKQSEEDGVSLILAS
jgi:hypothetical protein